MLFYVSHISALLESADQSHLSAENRYLKKVIIGGNWSWWVRASQNVEDFSPNCCPSSVLEGVISSASVSLWLFSRPPILEHYCECPLCLCTHYQHLSSCSPHSN